MLHQAHKLVNLCYRSVIRLLRASSVGVRAIVVNPAGEILLVKHTYTPGWYLPGGGVKTGETTKVAVVRELEEETGVIATAEPELFGIYHNRFYGSNDYPVVYVINDFREEEANSYEIAETAWFAPNNLPKDCVPSTQRRVQEFFFKQTLSEYW